MVIWSLCIVEASWTSHFGRAQSLPYALPSPFALHIILKPW